MQKEFNCSVCGVETSNIDLNPISGKKETICEDCLDQLWEQVQEIPED